MKLRTFFSSLLLLACALAPARAAAPLTLERIMADPDWIGPPVERPFWSLDGNTVLYSLKRPGSPVLDLWRVPAAGGAGGAVDAGRRAARVRPRAPSRRVRAQRRRVRARPQDPQADADHAHAGERIVAAVLRRRPLAPVPERQR